MRLARAAFVAVVAILALAGCSPPPKQKTIHVFCGAAVQAPAEALARHYDAAGVKFEFAGMNPLLGRMQTLPPGDMPDVFISVEETYTDQAVRLGLVDRREVLAYFTPVIIVSRKYAGPPIGSLKDLARPGLKVALGDSRGPAIGRVSDKLLTDAGVPEVIRSASRHDTPQHVATQVAVGDADAGIIWREISTQGDFAKTLNVVPIPGAALSKIEICRVTKAPNKDLADRFIDLAINPAGRAVFRQAGFPVEPATTRQD